MVVVGFAPPPKKEKYYKAPETFTSIFLCFNLVVDQLDVIS